MRVVLCNCPPDKAVDIARVVVQEKLAACVNLLPVRSIYVWDGELQDDAEVTLVLKTASETVNLLRDRLLALHPYDVPEVVVLTVDAAASAPDYVSWVRETTL
ncbi:MAG: periplasmic divalent cation tolerance protein [Myxococcota bacterium]|jgi:periplasmic divalent cation tolerance protein